MKALALFFIFLPCLLNAQYSEPDSIVNLFYYKNTEKSARNFCDSGYVKVIYNFEDIAEKDVEDYYKAAMSNLHPDSLEVRARLLRWISHYDKNPQLATMARQTFDSLKMIDIEKKYSQLTGEWQWNWSGSNWDTSNRPADCQCAITLQITRDSFYFYYNNELKMTRDYTLPRHNYSVGSDYFTVRIDGQCWVLSISDEPDYFWGGLGSTASTFLNINEMAGCSCGCPISIYEKK